MRSVPLELRNKSLHWTESLFRHYNIADISSTRKVTFSKNIFFSLLGARFYCSLIVCRFSCLNFAILCAKKNFADSHVAADGIKKMFQQNTHSVVFEITREIYMWYVHLQAWGNSRTLEHVGQML